MKKIKIFLVLLCGTLIASCESNTTQDVSTIVTNPTYKLNIQAITSSKCVGCHSGGKQYPDLETYNQVSSATKNGKLICRINGTCGSVMPTSGKLPQATIDMFQRWADQGYVNDVVNPTYTLTIKPIITAQCISCHSAGGSQSSSPFDNYTNLKLACQTDINGSGTVLCRIDGSCGSIMPQSGKMPQATIDIIKHWASNNYPN